MCVGYYCFGLLKNWDLVLWELKLSYKFAVQTDSQKPGQGNAGGSADIIGSVY